MTQRSRIVVAFMIGAAFLGAAEGCRSAPDPVAYARAYPAKTTRGETLNIQVFRRTKTVELTNTTAHVYGPSTLWLNMRFSRPIDGLKIGESLTLPLQAFRDEHSEYFRGGGFFASEPPDRLVLAQLETTGADGKPVMLGLVVVGGEAE